MYKLNYYSKITKGLASKEQEYEYLGMGEFFRLRKDAIHYLFEIVESEYNSAGYTTEKRVGGLYCYKNEMTAEGDRRLKEMLIKVEK